MTDITKCGNNACPLRHTCWRHLAPVNPSGYQTWAIFMLTHDVDADSWNCNGYWCYPVQKEPQ